MVLNKTLVEVTFFKLPRNPPFTPLPPSRLSLRQPASANFDHKVTKEVRYHGDESGPTVDRSI